VDAPGIGGQLRALRTASGRTVASVAADAGLSVPYIANLENGRGNPTVSALSQLAAAHGLRLAISLVPAGHGAGPGGPGAAGGTGAEGAGADGTGRGPAPAGGVPASLVRLGRTDRFRRTARLMAGPLGADEAEVSAQLVSVLTAAAGALRRDLAEADWWRLLDALLLIATSPAAG
jgi:transcriptional regulator with XRE-family HTH domain